MKILEITKHRELIIGSKFLVMYKGDNVVRADNGKYYTDRHGEILKEFGEDIEKRCQYTELEEPKLSEGLLNFIWYNRD